MAEHVNQQAQVTERSQEQQRSLIACQIVQALGRPADLLRVEVRHLWEKHYRANVLVGADVASIRIAHSFFLSIDEDGNIIASAPALARKYSELARSDERFPLLANGEQASHSST